MAVSVEENTEKRRFEVYEDGELAGFADAIAYGNAVAIPHTEVHPARGGRGLASELVRVTLETLRERDQLVLPYCPFVSAYIARHPEFISLVPTGQRAQFGLPQD